MIESRAATVDEEAVCSTAPIDEGVIMAMDEKLEEGCWRAALAVRQNLRESHLDREPSLAGTHLGRGLYALIRRRVLNGARFGTKTQQVDRLPAELPPHASDAGLHDMTIRLPRELTQSTSPIGPRELGQGDARVAIVTRPGYVSVNEIRATRTGFPALLPCIRTRSDADAHAS